MTLLAAFLALISLFGLVSKWTRRSFITGPMVFTMAGILVFFTLPGLSAPETTGAIILLISEITLAIVLFSDATHLSARRVLREADLPARLLGIGMPLAIVAGTLVALLLFRGEPLWEAAILATILAPTDASLGAAVVKSRLVPTRIREALDVESGLNDGLSVPLLVLFIALSGTQLHGAEQPWLLFTAQQIGLGVLVGIGAGWVGGLLMTQSERRDCIADEAKQLAMLSLAVLSWWLAEHVFGGNGFIAAFIADSALRFSYEHSDRHMTRFDEAWEDLLAYFVFFAFGVIAAPALQMIPGIIWLYALLSLTIVRMVPVALAVIGAKLRPASVLFLGWFGPRGLASVVLGMVYLEQVTRISANSTIVRALIATVLLSILAHGISANPGIKLYARQIAGSVTKPLGTPRSRALQRTTEPAPRQQAAAAPRSPRAMTQSRKAPPRQKPAGQRTIGCAGSMTSAGPAVEQTALAHTPEAAISNQRQSAIQRWFSAPQRPSRLCVGP